VKALLLAAGFGTRLRPITDRMPKCLVPIQGKPLLQYWLELLFKDGLFSQAVINTHYLPEVVTDFIEQSPWEKSITMVHEDELLGTAGTVLHNQDFFKEAFLLAHADNLTRFDPKAFIKAHQQRPPGVEITMMTFDTDAPETCGIVELNKDNIVMAFHEKSKEFKGTKANAAVYIVEPSVITFLKKLNKKIIDLSTEVLPHYLGKMQAFHNASYHRDIGNPQSLALAEAEY
jgi:mannose-1-phosphate guanylyltransferase